MYVSRCSRDAIHNPKGISGPDLSLSWTSNCKSQLLSPSLAVDAVSLPDPSGSSTCCTSSSSSFLSMLAPFVSPTLPVPKRSCEELIYGGSSQEKARLWLVWTWGTVWVFTGAQKPGAARSYWTFQQAIHEAMGRGLYAIAKSDRGPTVRSCTDL